jgi:hypothetical protein
MRTVSMASGGRHPTKGVPNEPVRKSEVVSVWKCGGDGGGGRGVEGVGGRGGGRRSE